VLVVQTLQGLRRFWEWYPIKIALTLFGFSEAHNPCCQNEAKDIYSFQQPQNSLATNSGNTSGISSFWRQETSQVLNNTKKYHRPSNSTGNKKWIIELHSCPYNWAVAASRISFLFGNCPKESNKLIFCSFKLACLCLCPVTNSVNVINQALCS